MKSIYVTRTIIENNEYRVLQVYKDGSTREIGKEFIKGKPSLSNIAKEYGVAQVVLQLVKKHYGTYAMEIDDFMAHAKKIY